MTQGSGLHAWRPLVWPPSGHLLPVGFWVPLVPLPSCLRHGFPSPHHRPEVVGVYVNMHLCVCVSGEGGRQPSSCHIYELINLCPEGSSCRETSPPAPPRRQSRWKLGASPHLGSGKKIFFFPLLSKNMLGSFFES